MNEVGGSNFQFPAADGHAASAWFEASSQKPLANLTPAPHVLQLQTDNVACVGLMEFDLNPTLYQPGAGPTAKRLAVNISKGAGS